VSELFDEVDEEVRRERLKKLWDEYSIYIIAGALLIIAAVGGWRGYQYLEAKKAAEAAFNDLAAKAPSGYRTLARLRAAAEVASRDPQGAAKLYDDIAADRSVGTTERDLARVRAAGLLLESTSYPSMLQRLEPATAPGATFRHTARELLALSAWRANDTAAARQWLDLIANDGETPPSLRSRAEALQGLLPPVAKS
jgi:hypothetical protein